MKAHTEYFTLRARERELLHMTDKVAEVLERSETTKNEVMVQVTAGKLDLGRLRALLGSTPRPCGADDEHTRSLFQRAAGASS